MNKMQFVKKSIVVLLISIFVVVNVNAQDWAQWRGPKQDAVCTETGLLQSWPETGPELAWEVSGLGSGYSAVSICDGKLFTMGDLKLDGQDAQCVIAVDMETHKILWTTKIGPIHKGDMGGPRCTPTIDDGLVYVIGTSGDLACLTVDKGDIVWSKNLEKDFDGKSPNWKYSESPFVDGDKVLCSSGNSNSIMIAFNKKTGDLIWKCSMPDIGEIGKEDAGYTPVIISNGGGVKQYLKMVGKGLISVSTDGKFLWGYNKVANRAATVPIPIVDGDYVFGVSGYNAGAALLKLSPDGDGVKMEEVYFIDGKDFQNHHGCVVKVGDYIYGGHGQNKSEPTCIDFKTGKIMWQEDQPGKGSAGVLYADGHVYFRYEDNKVVLVEANPEKFVVKSTFTPAKRDGATGQAWAHPVILDGKLYLRYADVLMVYNVKAE